MPEVAIPHGTIRYSDEGSGRPLVFLGGLVLGGGDAFERFFPAPVQGAPFPCPLAPEDQPERLAELIREFASPG